jgi:RNA polymerase sigma-70 factor, ECF subfamily
MSDSRVTPRRRAACDAAQFISDERLVAIAKMGHRPAFDELHRRHAEKMLYLVRRITRHHEDAEDAVQESFLSAYAHLRKFDGRARFTTWLSRIAINAALVKLRKHRRSRELPMDDSSDAGELAFECELSDSAPNPEQVCATIEAEATLRAAIAKLRPSLREVVELHELREYSMPETADALGISVAATKGRLFHARAALRRRTELKPAR